MKIINVTLIMFLFAGILFAQTNNNDKKIKTGMLLSNAKKILLNIGIKEEDRYLQHETPKNMKTSYFPIEESVDLIINYSEKDKKIVVLSIIFYPSYKPVRGLEIIKTLDYITFDSKSYIIKIKKSNKKL